MLLAERYNWKIIPILGFEARISGARGACFPNWVTIMALVSFECSLNQTVVLQQRQSNAVFCKINLIKCVCMSQWDSFQFLKQNDNKLVPEKRKLDLLVRNGFYGTNFSTRTSSQTHTSTLAQDRHTHTHTCTRIKLEGTLLDLDPICFTHIGICLLWGSLKVYLTQLKGLDLNKS